MSTLDVTEAMLEYAATRGLLWNGVFRQRAKGDKTWPAVEDFQEIDRLLLLSTLRHLEIETPANFFLGEAPVPGLSVALEESYERAEVLFTAEIQGFSNRSWQGGLWIQARDANRLEFVEFFDWDQCGFMTNSLVRARVAVLQGHDDLVGHDVMIELHRVRFLRSSD